MRSDERIEEKRLALAAAIQKLCNDFTADTGCDVVGLGICPDLKPQFNSPERQPAVVSVLIEIDADDEARAAG